MNPRALVKALHEHWPLVESLALRSRETPFLDRDVLARVSLSTCGQDPSMADESVRQLLQKGVLVAVGVRDEVQLHGPVRDFVLSLAQEQELGLAETIRVEIEEMVRLGVELQDALAKEDLSAMMHPLGRLGNRMQRISLQLAHDQQAILNIADRAKTFPVGTPLSTRYREVIESYDRYVEPMTQLLQRDEGGFVAQTERIEDQLIAAEALCERRGALVSQRRRLASTAYGLRILRQEARERLAACTETLLPLREEYLRNSGLAIAVASLLGVARKRGVKAVIPSGRLRLGGSTRADRVVPGRFAKAYMADIMRFEPKSVVFPEVLEGPPVMQARLRMDDVLRRLEAELPVPSLLPWLLQAYPEQDEKNLLRLYHELVRHFGDRAELHDGQTRERLQEHVLRYHPHALKEVP